MENNNKKMKYCIGNVIEENGKVFFHDCVIVYDIDSALGLVRSYLKDGIEDIRIIGKEVDE